MEGRRGPGLTVLFTGLSGAGKTTLARLLVDRLEHLGRRVTWLDGDEFRKIFSNELGFSRMHRDINIRRMSFVASEVTKHGGAAICSPIAPYDAARKEMRRMVGALGAFVLVHVSTPLSVCERRDPKGIYAKARMGSVSQFTAVSDPYEPPRDADIELDTSDISAEDGVWKIVTLLSEQGLLEDR